MWAPDEDGAEEDEALDALGDLLRYSLLEYEPERTLACARYHPHDLVRAGAHACVRTLPPARPGARLRRGAAGRGSGGTSRPCRLGPLSETRRRGDRQFGAYHLGNLGNAYHSLGEYRRAIEYHEQALQIDWEIGDRGGQGNALWNMSLALDALGQRAEESLTIREQIESPYAEMVRKQLAEWRGENPRKRGWRFWRR